MEDIITIPVQLYGRNVDVFTDSQPDPVSGTLRMALDAATLVVDGPDSTINYIRRSNITRVRVWPVTQ